MTDYKERINPKLVERIDALCVKANDLYMADNGDYDKTTTHVAEYLSDKWCRITTCRGSAGNCVYAFVALDDYENKTLGKVRRGDIHKAATLKAPAKHARGSVWDDNFGNCLTTYGVTYLKG